MKRTYASLIVLMFCLALILAACTPVAGKPSGDDGKALGKTDAPPAEATDAPVETLPAPVINPDQVLSAAEASQILGLPVTIEADSLSVDQEHGISSLRYAYTLSEMTDVSALLQIEQDGLKPAKELEEGLTARSSFDFQAELLKDEITPVKDMGDAAFLVNNDGQLFMAYRGYFVVVAIATDEYDSTKNGPLNIALGRIILKNMQQVLDE